MSDEMKVERFDMWNVNDHGEMAKDEEGEYVLYTDYAALQQQLAAAREELSKLEKGCVNIACGTPCEKHSGDNTPSFEWFAKFSDECFVCTREALQRISVVEPYDALSYKANEIARAALATLQRDRQP